VRFATTFDFRIDPATKEAVRREAGSVTVVSAERIAVELRKMVVHPRRARAVDLLRDLMLLPAVLPESEVLWAPTVSTHPDARSATWDSTLGILDKLERPTFPVALAGLLWGIRVRSAGAGLVNAICRRWRLSNDERKTIVWTLDQERLLRTSQSVPWPRLQRVLVEPAVGQLLSLANAIAAELDEGRQQVEACRRKLDLPREVLDPPPLITGTHLRQAGFRPGPLFRRILEEVRDAQLLGRLTTREEALEMARRISLCQENHG